MSAPPPGSAGTPPRTTGPLKNRLPVYIGTAVAAIAAYYFYNAGGDPTVARKEMKHDASRASASIRDELPGRGKETKAGAEEAMARAGSNIDSTVRDGKSRIAEGQHKLEETKDKTGKAIMGKIDEADLKVENEASKAKSGISSWFGGK
ncbi:hypothetical protein L873DRAFT_405701 [Choiromyces venosus 120613-1]|uniref:Calcofluor white hypersensitive protein n=1 Tax=Choiromyces venosus 120613-1 TaxID=1336337 RepID=A0A3N4JVV1_9PEZI|nr:hypothetical protein L873DRAFT_405701 [Choiromyces venosus 120613-1]